MSLAELREAARRAHAAVGDPSARWDEQALAFHRADSAYRTELAARLTQVTAGDGCDLPPCYHVGKNDDGQWTVCDLIGAWDDEVTAPDREGARLECWRRFVRADLTWAERLLSLLTVRMPEVPELPPGYEIGDCEDGTWAIRVDGCYHDGLDEDEIPTTREEAIDVAWSDWWRGASKEWREFMTEIGAFADEDEE